MRSGLDLVGHLGDLLFGVSTEPMNCIGNGQLKGVKKQPKLSRLELKTPHLIWWLQFKLFFQKTFSLQHARTSVVLRGSSPKWSPGLFKTVPCFANVGWRVPVAKGKRQEEEKRGKGLLGPRQDEKSTETTCTA